MLKLCEISKRYRNRQPFALNLKDGGAPDAQRNRQVLDHLNLEVAQGEFAAILGPSGCGKTTLLKIIAGILDPDDGQVFWKTTQITKLPAAQRDCSLVFQNYALLPNLTVFGNIAFPLVARNYAAERSWIRKIRYLLGSLDNHLTQDQVHEVYAVLKLVRLEHYGPRLIQSLSGGEAQRIALARSLVTRPQLVLMDEPLANLDRQLKLELRQELKRIHQALGITFVYVTHDQEEAVSLAGRIALLNDGRIIQSGSAREIIKNPANEWVKGFFNVANIVHPELLNLAS